MPKKTEKRVRMVIYKDAEAVDRYWIAFNRTALHEFRKWVDTIAWAKGITITASVQTKVVTFRRRTRGEVVSEGKGKKKLK